MKLSEFDFELPKELVAQEPLDKRDLSRLMIYHADNKKIEDKKFSDIVNYFEKGQVLVRNVTKVFPARIFGKKETGMKIEFLLIKRIKTENNNIRFLSIASPFRRLHLGSKIIFQDGLIEAKVIEKRQDDLVLEFYFKGDFFEILNRIGEPPLPKYICKKIKDNGRYQTVYAKEGESAAAPTAGLHFTEEIFKKLKKKGVEILDLNLNIGLGTFSPIFEEDIDNHKMHEEDYFIPKETAERINLALREKRSIVALGTTSLRALESAVDKNGFLKYGNFSTNIFIKPGYQFKIVNSIITNFHLPKSSLIILISALIGKDETLRIYQEAISKKYRFFSFGDAMMIIKNPN